MNLLDAYFINQSYNPGKLTFLGLVHTYGLNRSQVDLAFIRAECERSHLFEIDLGSIQPGSLQEVV